MSDKYNDILYCSHTSTRKRMPPENRAAQFAPFAALTGYDELIKNTEHDSFCPDAVPEELLYDEL